jgi:CRP-like cAMP-binding protein
MSLQHLPLSELPYTHGPAEAVSRGANLFLSNLSQADLANLRPYLLERPLRRGECLYSPGQLIDTVIFPQSGIVSLTIPTKGGIAVETAMLGREGVLDLGAAFGIRHALCTAIVQFPGSALAMSAAHFREAIAGSQVMREQVVRCMAMLMVQAQQSAACNAIHEVEQRMARWLLETHDRAERNDLPLTQTFLAEMLGVQRTTVTLIAGKLQRIGAIHTFRGRVQIVDRAILESAACECYERVRTCTRQLFGTRDHLSKESRNV